MKKSVSILGISGLYHDSSAALLVDGKIVYAAQEERFSRKKHDSQMPVNAIKHCLSEAKLSIEKLDYVVFYEKPLLKFERLLETYFAYAPRGFKQFLMGIPQWLDQKLHLPRELDKALENKYTNKYIFTEHHESHAASAFFPSPFEEAVIVTLDGVGEWATTSIGIGKGNKIELLYEMYFPHSLGLLYSAFTYFTGFKVNSGEYKLMGLAPYGCPIYYDRMMDNLLDIKEDGSFRLNMDYFTYCYTDVMTGKKMETLFDGPRRSPESQISRREMDIAASIQKVTEEIMLRIVRHAHELTGMKNLVLSGGCALNCVANGKIFKNGPFENMWIQPAAGDAGSALGAAMFVHYQLLGNERKIESGQDSQHGSLLGPSFSGAQITGYLDSVNAVYHTINDEEKLLESVVDQMQNGNVIGWFHGRMEFGPRALGSRSIIGDPRNEEMQTRMNLKIKFRESFRPFAPSILRENANEYFDFPNDKESPYMLLVTPVQKSKRCQTGEETNHLTGIELLKVKRSEVPSITHVDYSARLQTVDEKRHGRYYRLIRMFREK
ncbi:MAG TPA: carbamoyltransferase N-terminal domain-containing protein, partial [Sedimentisphaerales bacterium]|nr:carbamoyltransferase N-terminal domain-containing protein [Sedimentisphaerales bacterium]